MFLTLGFVLGFVAGWYVNEKLEDVTAIIAKLNPFKKK